MNQRAAATAVVLLLCACAPQPPAPTPAARGAPPDFPEAYYRQARTAGRSVLEVDPAKSLLVVVVRRGGSLARLGHDHVVASHDIAGFVAPADGRADLYLALERLVVDEAPLRDAAAGRIAAAITLHGVTREVQIPARIEQTADEVSASGSFDLKQTDFGIVPLSVLGGAIQVLDRLELRFAIRARRGD
jgi:hypothetical protein